MTGVGFGPSMFLAVTVPGVSVVTLDNLENYGLLTVISQPQHRERGLNTYKHIYGQAIVTSPVMDFLGQTGLDVLKGADLQQGDPGANTDFRGIYSTILQGWLHLEAARIGRALGKPQFIG